MKFVLSFFALMGICSSVYAQASDLGLSGLKVGMSPADATAQLQASGFTTKAFLNRARNQVTTYLTDPSTKNEIFVIVGFAPGNNTLDSISFNVSDELDATRNANSNLLRQYRAWTHQMYQKYGRATTTGRDSKNQQTYCHDVDTEVSLEQTIEGKEVDVVLSYFYFKGVCEGSPARAVAPTAYIVGEPRAQERAGPPNSFGQRATEPQRGFYGEGVSGAFVRMLPPESPDAGMFSSQASTPKIVVPSSLKSDGVYKSKYHGGALIEPNAPSLFNGAINFEPNAKLHLRRYEAYEYEYVNITYDVGFGEHNQLEYSVQCRFLFLLIDLGKANNIRSALDQKVKELNITPPWATGKLSQAGSTKFTDSQGGILSSALFIEQLSDGVRLAHVSFGYGLLTRAGPVIVTRICSQDTRSPPAASNIAANAIKYSYVSERR